MRIERSDLLGIPNAAVVATIDSGPVEPDGFVEGGSAALEVEGNFRVPLIVAVEPQSEILLKHEKIHLCQYLLANAWPAAAEIVELLGSDSQCSVNDPILFKMEVSPESLEF